MFQDGMGVQISHYALPKPTSKYIQIYLLKGPIFMLPIGSEIVLTKNHFVRIVGPGFNQI